MSNVFDSHRLPPAQMAAGEPHFHEDQRKRPFTAPKLKFVKPKLTKQGALEQLTAGQNYFDE